MNNNWKISYIQTNLPIESDSMNLMIFKQGGTDKYISIFEKGGICLLTVNQLCSNSSPHSTKFLSTKIPKIPQMKPHYYGNFCAIYCG